MTSFRIESNLCENSDYRVRVCAHRISSQHRQQQQQQQQHQQQQQQQQGTPAQASSEPQPLSPSPSSSSPPPSDGDHASKTPVQPSPPSPPQQPTPPVNTTTTLTGAFSPGVQFRTKRPEPVVPASRASKMGILPPAFKIMPSRRKFSERDWACIFVAGFSVIAIFIAWLVSYIISNNGGAASGVASDAAADVVNDASHEQQQQEFIDNSSSQS